MPSSQLHHLAFPAAELERVDYHRKLHFAGLSNLNYLHWISSFDVLGSTEW